MLVSKPNGSVDIPCILFLLLTTISTLRMQIGLQRNFVFGNLLFVFTFPLLKNYFEKPVLKKCMCWPYHVKHGFYIEVYKKYSPQQNAYTKQQISVRLWNNSARRAIWIQTGPILHRWYITLKQVTEKDRITSRNSHSLLKLRNHSTVYKDLPFGRLWTWKEFRNTL